MTLPARLAFLALMLPLALPGCSALSALGGETLEIYELQTAPAQAQSRTRSVELVVEPPVGSGALATERIAIRPAALQVQYLPGVRWADPAPAMLQTLMLRSLSETGAFASVGRAPLGAIGDYALLSELTDFQAAVNDATPGATVTVRLIVRLVRERDARVVASRTFTAIAASADTDADSIAAAFDVATGQMLAELVPWVLARAG
ncbi:ABC-type transport auxiliary lipoprotein family protein [Marinibacterium profundimaris]|uniref:ABC-type transport auxiliary lipoprotein component domain-containing protein n=1 Tax=Marinibacterium profundimaris TaxID=1679460 RepID=A0A225NID3_9RHOB|nr:ABC-type transport auxiliary lipoprotein family protein [Marinibacterium profundimaris]OWU73622.1 hypothetical protein ATO3_13350 [Marinibacterium profundimaris]